jgi:hypothetical protein
MFEFMCKLFHNAKDVMSPEEQVLRRKIRKKLKASLKQRCNCTICAQLFAKPVTKENV